MRKNPVIELPVVLILTDEGEYFFNQRHRTLEYAARTSKVGADGLVLNAYSAKTLQRLIFAGYISRIEISRADFTSKRNQILDLAKLVAYGVLFREYSIKLGKELKETPIVANWNRKNPSRALNQSNITKHALRDGEQVKNVEVLQEVQKEVIEEIFNFHAADLKGYSSEEMQMLNYKAANFMQQLNPIIWALMAQQRGTQVFSQTVQAMESIVWQFLSKANIADYLALLVLELVTQAEKSLMEEAVQTYLKGRIELDHFMKNKNDRLKVLQSLSDHNKMATLSWKIQARRGSMSDSSPFQIMLYNRSIEHENIRRELEDKKNLKTDGKALSEFYEQLPGESEDQLGLYYLTYLQEECKRQGTLFDSYVNFIDQHNLTFITLSIRF